jgi:Ca2+/H+ antiporter
MIFGAAVLLFGIILLLNKLGIISGSVWGYFWPILLIVVGLAIIFGRRRMRDRWWNRFPPDDNKKP